MLENQSSNYADHYAVIDVEKKKVVGYLYYSSDLPRIGEYRYSFLNAIMDFFRQYTANFTKNFVRDSTEFTVKSGHNINHEDFNMLHIFFGPEHLKRCQDKNISPDFIIARDGDEIRKYTISIRENTKPTNKDMDYVTAKLMASALPKANSNGYCIKCGSSESKFVKSALMCCKCNTFMGGF